ncbi:MAG TPA: ParA family protein [Terriglobales bacterium]|nr:ParA family protein [Terriglobales bacterium]
MNATIVAFFNNKGGVGKTTLVYHLAWMYQDLGLRVIASDLDPQANLTAAFLDDDRLMELWPANSHPSTMFGAVRPLLRGTGDIADPGLESITDALGLLAGDLALSTFEDQLSETWPKCLGGDEQERAFRVTTAFWRIMQNSANRHGSDVVLMDLGPNLGAINRAALIAADYVVVPLSPDLFSLQGLRNLGPKLRSWRSDWTKRREAGGKLDFQLPPGSIQPVGYVVQQHSVRLDRPVKAYERWIDQVPAEYATSVLGQQPGASPTVKDDPNCLAQLKHYRSLIPMAQESRKPMFHLKPADGAMGSHYQAAQSARRDFQALAEQIAQRCGVPIRQGLWPMDAPSSTGASRS